MLPYPANQIRLLNASPVELWHLSGMMPFIVAEVEKFECPFVWFRQLDLVAVSDDVIVGHWSEFVQFKILAIVQIQRELR